MTIWIWLMNKLFRREYVLLIFHDGDRKVCHAYQLGDSIYAHPYLPNTRTQLLPGGKVDGAVYIKSWKPITYKTSLLYNKDTAGNRMRVVK